MKCNFKLADYHRFYRDTTTIGLVMTAFGASILGYFRHGMTVEDIMTVGGIGVYGYGVGVLISKIT